MLNLFGSVAHYFKLKPQSCTIDNWIFQLHYRATTLIFLVATILVTSRQYFGQHIKCLNDLGKTNFDINHVIETFCFVTTTFTVVSQKNNVKNTKIQKFTKQNEHHDQNKQIGVDIAHPGVGPYGVGSKQPIKHHSYYQWVPFVLFAQALMFHLTHLFWKRVEGGRIRLLTSTLSHSEFSCLDHDLSIGNKTIPSLQIK